MNSTLTDSHAWFRAQVGDRVLASDRALVQGKRAVSSLAYDRWMVGLSAWLIGGVFLDGWAHVNLPGLETFFTPWHAVLYSGFLAVAALIGVGVGRSAAGRPSCQCGWP